LELGRNDKIRVCSLSIVAFFFENGRRRKWERKPTDFVTEVMGRGQRAEGSTVLINAKLTILG
jgi:hypothetical protein